MTRFFADFSSTLTIIAAIKRKALPLARRLKTKPTLK